MASGSQNMTSDKARQAFYLQAPHEAGGHTDQYGNLLHNRGVDENNATATGDYWNIKRFDGTAVVRVYWETGEIDGIGTHSITLPNGSQGEFYAIRGNVGVWMGIGSGNTNHGLYSDVKGDWMIYANSSGSVQVNGNAATATIWQTTRTFTVGATGKNVNGSADVSWSMNEIMGSSNSTKFYRGDKTWSNALTGDISIGSREVTSGPSSITYSNRITIIPYFHTGGPWYIKSGDDANNAWLSIYYGSTQILRMKHDGTQALDWKGNASTATKLSNTPNNTTTFLRGDNTWSATLANTLTVNGLFVKGAGVIEFENSGSWGSSSATFPNNRGSIYWSGTSDWCRIFCTETASDNFQLIVDFGDDTSPSMILRDRGTNKITLTPSSSTISATTFSGALNGNASTASKILDSNNSTAITASYNAGGVSSFSWATVWNGYHLTYISKADLMTQIRGVASGSWGISVTGSSASCTGNAASATKLQTARSLWGNSFNGTTDINGSISMGSGTAIKFTATAGDTATSTPTALTYGRLQAYGTLCINADTDGSTTEYCIITSGRGMSNSTADGLAIGYNSLTWKGTAIVYNSGSWGISITGSAGSVAWANTGHPSTFPPSSHTHSVSEITWANGQNLSCTGGGEWSVDMNADGYWHVWSSTKGTTLACYQSTGYVNVPIHLYVGGYNNTSYGLSASSIACNGNLWVSASNATGGGIILADDGDIVDLNDGYCSMRFSYGVRIFSANRGGSAVITLYNTGHVYASGELMAPKHLRIGSTILRNDGSDVWFLIGTANTAGDNWNSLRPLRFNIGTGIVYMEHGLRVVNDSSNSGDDAMVYFRHRSNNDWTVKIDSSGYDYGLNIITADNAGSALIANGNIKGHAIWANQGTNGERNMGVDSSTSGNLYFYAHTSGKGIYSGSGYQTGAVLTINGSQRLFYGTKFISHVGAGILQSSDGHFLQVQNDNNLVFYGPSSNVVWATWTASSRRVKNNIVPVTDSELINFNKLNVISFTYKPEMKMEDTDKQYGLIAEEVMRLYPNLVRIPKDYSDENFDLTKGWEQPLITLKYEGFIPLLIKMVQKQQKEIEYLKSQIQK